MIKITNLNKTYFVKDGDPVYALKEIDLTLPDKGLVFVVGKSGSGKSTLLNLLGSLDNITSGEIVADNIVVNKMSIEEASSYRDNYVGFIFQDFCLINTLSVEDNILISLDIKNQTDKELLNETLKMVGLEGFNNRLPNSLSAGQKQRVAIARGYIKKPKLLLCDEPTGNLDSKTSKQVLDILKDLSKDTLVIIVSHNIDDAYLYGERIIEISDGEIIKDVTNVSESSNYIVEDRKLYVANVNNISKEDLEIINEKLKNKEFDSIHAHNELFQEKEENYGEMQSFSLENNKYLLKDRAKLSWKFQKKKMISTFITSFISAIVMVLFGLCQFFTAFSLNDVMQKTLSSGDQKVFALKKAYYRDRNKSDISTSNLVSITDSDLEAVKNSSYKGKVYTLYDYTVPISLKSWRLLNETSVSDSTNLKEFYAQEAYGVLPVDEPFLKQAFGDFTYTGNLTDKDYGIIITDYLADSILYHRSETFSSYSDILGTYRNKEHSIYGYINAIIDTGYKQRYQSLINRFIIYYQSPKSQDLDKIVMSDEYLRFYEEIKNYLCVTYSLNPDFEKATHCLESKNFTMMCNTQIKTGDEEEKIDISSEWTTIDSEYGYDLPDNTLGISLETLKRILELPETTTMAEASVYNGQQFTIIKNRRYNPDDIPVYEKKVNIQVIDSTYFAYIVSDDLLSHMREYDVIPYSLYFDDLDTAPQAYQALKDVPFVPRSSYIEAGVSINSVVQIFNDIFVLIAITLLVGILLILGFYNFVSINHRKFDIGVFKALGMKNKDIASIYILQILFGTILMIAFFTIGLVIFTHVANGILFRSFMRFLRNPALKAISILTFNPWILLLDIVVIIIVNILITLIPFLMMKKIEPLGIIRKSN